MKQIRTFIFVFIIWTIVGQVSKLLFLMFYSSVIGEYGISDFFGVLTHGMILDFAIAGYLTIVPGIMLIASLWYRGKYLKWIWNGYFAMTAFICAIAYVANLVLYGYWNYPLDSSPLLYIKTSPRDAFASASIWQLLLVFASVLAITVVIVFCFMKLFPKEKSEKKLLPVTIILLLSALLVIPIRGGFGTGTNHTGTVYFSDNIRLNHAAVNPIFSFIESASHQQDLGSMYRFMDDGKASALMDPLCYTKLRTDSVEYLTTNRPNVIVIMLESFSKYIMNEGGHVKGVTPCLDALTKEGLYFSNFYANSVRTDRAMVSILSGFPAQPTLSIMDMPKKSTSLPSLASTLGKEGYSTAFYYGGDTNFSNMRSYYMGTGYEKIVAEYDFPAELRTTKWGVADGPVYQRMLKDIMGVQRVSRFQKVSRFQRVSRFQKVSKGSRFFYTLMTESSHEPFDVPYKSGFKEEELNAFAYADHCLGEFISQLKKLPCWKNTVVVIVPDHLGAWPRIIDNYAFWRYEMPLLMIGGAVKQNKVIPTIGCQTDIAATLLGMMKIDHSDFTYSKDILDPKAPHFAFFTVDDAMGMVNDKGSVIYDNISGKVMNKNGNAEILLMRSKAYLQKLFDDIDKR